MIAVKPISFPDDLEVRVYPLSRKNDAWLGGFFPMTSHRTWDWVLRQYPLREEVFEDAKRHLEAGETANLVRGEMTIDLPEDAEWPDDD